MIASIIVIVATFIPGVRESTVLPPGSVFYTKVWFIIRKRKKIIGILGAISTAIIGCWSNEEQEKNQNLLTSKSDTIQTLLGRTGLDVYKLRDSVNASTKLIELQRKALSDSTGKIVNLYIQLNKSLIESKSKSEVIAQKADSYSKQLSAQSDSIVNLANSIINLTNKNLNYLNGGDSWCSIDFYAQSNNDIKIRVHHRGEYPLHGLRIDIIRLSDIEKEAKGNGSYLKGLVIQRHNAIVFPIGLLPKSNWPVELGTIPFNPLIDETFSIHFVAQNGKWEQLTTLKKGLPTKTTVSRDKKTIMSYSY